MGLSKARELAMKKALVSFALSFSLGIAPLPAGGAEMLKTLILDPGHGGRELGARSAGGLAGEKDLALSLARRLRERLRDLPFLKVVSTRADDYSLGADDRASRANHHRGDLFISLHFYPDPYRSGFVILYPKPRVRPTVGASGWQVPGETHLDMSLTFAEILAEELTNATNTPCLGIISARLRVFKGLRMPGVFLELGSLADPARAKELNSSEGQRVVAEGIYRAVARYRRLLELGGHEEPGSPGEPKGGRMIRKLSPE